MAVDHDRWRAFVRKLLADRKPRPAEPSGESWQAEMGRRGGRPFTGGAVCWDPATACEGICRDCPREWGETS